MKNLILILAVSLTSNIVANELSWVDEQIEAIKPSRIGVYRKDISSIKNPFIFVSKKVIQNKDTNSSTKKGLVKKSTPVIHRQTFTLSMVFNNSAMINGHWYKMGDSLSGYKVSQIQRATVVLKNQTNKILLSTRSKNKKLKFQK